MNLPFWIWPGLAFAEGGGAGDAFRAMVPVLLIFAIFYFLMVVPMRKRQKAVEQMLSNLKRGDRVVTSGGVYGEVAAIEEGSGTVLLKIADSVKVRVAKSAITGLEAESDKGSHR
jgi:preprotein translocase subunit YajC